MWLRSLSVCVDIFYRVWTRTGESLWRSLEDCRPDQAQRRSGWYLEIAETALPLVRPTDAAIPLAWTFMSEILTRHGRIIERLSMYNKVRFDRVSWPCDGHECPSYIRLCRHRTQNLIPTTHKFRQHGSPGRHSRRWRDLRCRRRGPRRGTSRK